MNEPSSTNEEKKDMGSTVKQGFESYTYAINPSVQQQQQPDHPEKKKRKKGHADQRKVSPTPTLNEADPQGTSYPAKFKRISSQTDKSQLPRSQFKDVASEQVPSMRH